MKMQTEFLLLHKIFHLIYFMLEVKVHPLGTVQEHREPSLNHSQFKKTG